MHHLGLDVSTSCTGWAITAVNGAGEITNVELGRIELDKENDLIEKSSVVLKILTDLAKCHNIQKVYVEENLQAFSSGASSAQTLLKLAKFNGIVTYLSYQATGVTPVSVNVNHARKVLGINLKREKVCGITTKDQIYGWVSAHPLLKDYQWPMKVISSGPRKGQSVLEKYVYDMSDAFVIALSGPIVSS